MDELQGIFETTFSVEDHGSNDPHSGVIRHRQIIQPSIHLISNAVDLCRVLNHRNEVSDSTSYVAVMG